MDTNLSNLVGNLGFSSNNMSSHQNQFQQPMPSGGIPIGQQNQPSWNAFPAYNNTNPMGRFLI